MLIIDEKTREILKDFKLDENKGVLFQEQLPVFYRYILEEPAEYEEVVVAEYPETGGKDVEYREIKAEKGHWEMLNEKGEILDYPIQIEIEYFGKDEIVQDILSLNIYHAYTAEELAKIKAQEEERIRQEEEAAKKEAIFNALPDRVDNVEDTQDAVVLLLADLVGGVL